MAALILVALAIAIAAALAGLGPASTATALAAGGSAWAGLGPHVLPAVGRLAKAHVDAFWNLSASIDVDRLRGGRARTPTTPSSQTTRSRTWTSAV